MRFLSIILSLLVFGVHAEESVNPVEYVSIEEFQKALSAQNKKVAYHLTGDINNDGVSDLVGLIGIDRGGEQPPFIQLAVLTGLPNGHYVRRLLTSEVENHYEGSPSSWFEVGIRNGSIYIETYGHTCCEFGSTIYQFKFFKEQWRLVGIKSTSGNYASDGDSNHDTSNVIDTNMLTGVTISILQREGKRTERRYRRKVGVFLLNDFDFSGAYAQSNLISQ